ncbi:MAG: tRNA (guanosine(37)-N1)-methyltransferase TrmD [Patescibacteria group bacterium]
MKQFDIITIFPKIFNSYFNESIIRRAIKFGKIKINTINLRDFSIDKHKTVDEKPYGGGAGMVLMAEPLIKAVDYIKKSGKNKKIKTVVFSAKGKQFNQKTAYDLAKKYDQIIFICGRYEGIDERVKNILKADEISIGPYVLTDGDAAAMVVISAISRLIPGVIKLESLKEESHFNLRLEYPHYTRPETLEYNGKKYRVPKILLSGNHKKIAEWRENHKSY